MADQMPQVECARCGKVNRGRAKFCVSCGHALEAAPALGQSPDVQRQASEAQVGQQPSAGDAGPVRSAPVAPLSSSRPPAPAPAAAAPQTATTAPMHPSATAQPAPAGSPVDGGGRPTLASALRAVTDLVRDFWASTAGDTGVESQASVSPAPTGDYGLELKPVSGKASDAGQVRVVNEDSLIAFEFTKIQESRGVPVGFYVVADGMGGHKAGEIASRTVNKIITEKVLNAEVIPGLAFATRKLDETPGSVLTAAIQEANRTLYNLARTQGNDMGTTLTAALLIGDTATIANVGDSRTYLWRGSLRQITRDHSLVASLVQAGMLKPADVRSHPQRSQVYRTLGIKPDVEVDIFTETLQRGDRLILCSDGLWEMVTDAEIGRTVAQTRSPQEICQALVQQANRAGGKDNITVIVVKVE